MHLIALYTALSLSFGVLAIPATTICNQDNVLRALENPTDSVAASAFCSTYIRSTVTIQTTVTTTPVTTTSITLPDALTTLSFTEVDTSTNTIYTTFSTIVTLDIISSVTYQSTPLAFTTPPNGIYARQDPTSGLSELLEKIATVPPTRISSACSCLITTPPALSITQTVTSTVISTLTDVLGPLETDTISSITTATTSVDDLETVTTPTTTTTITSLTVTTLPPAPTETIICALPGGENAAAVSHLIFQGNGIGFNDCLQLCKNTPACLSIFWFGDVTDNVITCRMVTLTAAESINPDLVGLPDSFYFSDKDCPFVTGPIGW